MAFIVIIFKNMDLVTDLFFFLNVLHACFPELATGLALKK